MAYKLNIKYKVIESNSDRIFVGDYLFIHHNKKEDEYYGYDYYHLLLPVRDASKTFYGMPPVNSVIRIETKEELLAELKKIKIVPDKEFANERINDLLEEIEKIKKKYEL